MCFGTVNIVMTILYLTLVKYVVQPSTIFLFDSGIFMSQLGLSCITITVRASAYDQFVDTIWIHLAIA